jgi:hypothetical protein
MRSKTEQLERLVCAEHCWYFKPWTGEERRCRAQEWLIQRAAHGAGALDELQKLRGVRPAMPLRSDSLLLRATCTRCDYYPYQCNYRKPTRSPDAIPCGAVIVLSLLLERGLLSAEELYDPPWHQDAEGS